MAGFKSKPEPRPSEAVDLWHDQVLRELGDIKGDVRVIKCRLGIEGICPPGEPK